MDGLLNQTLKHFFLFTGALGDFILFAPVLTAFSTAVIAGKKSHARLLDSFSQNNFLDSSSSMFDSLFSEDFIADQIIEKFSSFDEVVLVKSDPAGVLKNNLINAGLSRVRVHAPFASSGSIASHHAALASQLGAQYRPLVFSGSDASRSTRLLILPGSGSPAKNWPLEYFLKTAEHFKSINPLFVLGPAEEGWQNKLNGFAFVRTDDLLEIKKLFLSSTHALGNDSGLSHLAAACSVETAVICPSNNLSFWQNAHLSVQIISADTISEITPHQVCREICR